MVPDQLAHNAGSSEKFGCFGVVWYLLTDPSRAISDAAIRRKSQLLSSLLVVIIPLATLSITVQLLIVPGFESTFFSTASGIGVLLLAYGFNRSGRYIPGAILTIITPIAASVGSLLTNPGDFIAFTFLFMSLVFASIFLSVRGTALVAVGNLIAICVLPLVSPFWQFSAIFGPLAFHVIISVLVVLGMRYRNLIEKDRQAALVEGNLRLQHRDDALRQSEERYRLFLEQSPIGIQVFDPDGNLLQVNRAWEKMWGIDSATVVGLYNVLKDQQLADMGMMHLIERSFVGEDIIMPEGEYDPAPIGTSGRKRWIQSRTYAVKDRDDRIKNVVALAEDISDRKNAEQALRESEARFRSVADTAADGIICANSNGTITYWNPAAEVIFGHPAAEVIDQPLSLIMPERYLNDDRTGIARFIATGKPVVMGTIVETVGLRKDGSEFPLELSLSTWQTGGQSYFGAICRNIAERKIAEQVLRDLNIELEKRVNERTAELRAANEHLHALTRLKDEFVANVSHELRTPVTSIKLYHNLLVDNPSKTAVYLDTLQRETDRLAAIIESLLVLTRMDQGEVPLSLSTVDLNELVSSYVDDRPLLAEAMGLGLALEQERDMPSVHADADLLGQTLSVMMTNALNYTPAGGNVTIRTHTKEEKGSTWVGFSVCDTGPGISREEQSQLFERFFRGKAGYESGAPGTGLGLAIACEIVDRHGGEINVESEGIPGEGSTFSVWLPTNTWLS